MTEYKTWPIGNLPKTWQRPELDIIKDHGYDIEDPRDAIDIFEKKIAKFTGSKYAVSVDSCTNAIFLCLKYLDLSGTVTIPSRTYVSVPMSIIHAGYEVSFRDMEWSGLYHLSPFPIYDSAARFCENMYIDGAFQCLSFQIKKRLPIGKGGMILTDNPLAYEWFKRARYEGRNLSVPYDEEDFDMIGWNMYMTPEDAARGILLFDKLEGIEYERDITNQNSYPDLSTKKIFNKGR